MDFTSILFATPDADENDRPSKHAPEYFTDLNLDRIVHAIIQGREEYDIEAFFFYPLKNIENIYYRQGVIQDVANKAIYSALMDYSMHMKEIRGILGNKGNLFYHFQRRRWELECVILYCAAVSELCAKLNELPLASCGMRSLKSYVNEYCQNEAFLHLSTTALSIKNKLKEIQYVVRIKGNAVVVEQYRQEINYSDEIIHVFSKFKQRDVSIELAFKSSDTGMNHVEAQILDCVARLFSREFDELDTFIVGNPNYQDGILTLFEREMQFYLAYVEYMERFKSAALPFCIPAIIQDAKDIFASTAFDLALADSAMENKLKVICNEFYLQDNERVFVVSGPNQGGKTTFARMVGQLHYLALLGVFIPAHEARLYLADRIFTHFEKSENIHNLRGKLYDDLVRIKAILDSATSRSLIIMNEIFTSTTTRDAVYLGAKIMGKILRLDALCVCVTFIDELTHLNAAIVSMMSTVDDHDYALRTYKVIRKPADGVAYSTSLVQKHGLTYEKIKARLGR